jgi:hypothetical protein
MHTRPFLRADRVNWDTNLNKTAAAGSRNTFPVKEIKQRRRKITLIIPLVEDQIDTML